MTRFQHSIDESERGMKRGLVASACFSSSWRFVPRLIRHGPFASALESLAPGPAVWLGLPVEVRCRQQRLGVETRIAEAGFRLVGLHHRLIGLQLARAGCALC